MASNAVEALNSVQVQLLGLWAGTLEERVQAEVEKTVYFCSIEIMEDISNRRFRNYGEKIRLVAKDIDAATDVALSILQGKSTFDPAQGDLGPFIYRAIQNRLYSVTRSVHRQPTHLESMELFSANDNSIQANLLSGELDSVVRETAFEIAYEQGKPEARAVMAYFAQELLGETEAVTAKVLKEKVQISKSAPWISNTRGKFFSLLQTRLSEKGVGADWFAPGKF
jgi:hypothetical protein